MDLIVLVLVCCAVGFLVWLLTTQIPLPPYWATAIQLLALIVVVIWVIGRLGIGVALPHLLR